MIAGVHCPYCGEYVPQSCEEPEDAAECAAGEVFHDPDA